MSQWPVNYCHLRLQVGPTKTTRLTRQREKKRTNYWVVMTVISQLWSTCSILAKYSLSLSLSLSLSKFISKLVWKETFPASFIYIYIYFFFVNFENLTVEFHVSYVLNVHFKFRSNWILFTIRSMNLFFIHNFRS